MPLLHKKHFAKKRLPAGINPRDKVFYCELTGEVFTDYDEYWERLVLCNAMVWTCAITGRTGLTYQEALDSEAKGLKFLSGIDKSLRPVLLFLTSLTRRGRHADVIDDVFNHVRDRYFPGEKVEAIIKKHWYDCQVIRVIYPTKEEIQDYEMRMAESDDEETGIAIGVKESLVNGCGRSTIPSDGSSNRPIVLDDDSDADSDIQVIGETTPVKMSNIQQTTPVKKSPDSHSENYPPYATYKYEVEEEQPLDDQSCKRHIVSWEQIRRSKVSLTREKVKLFIKLCTELSPQGFWIVKRNITEKYKLSAMNYLNFFPGNPPTFTTTLSKKMPLSLSPRGQAALMEQQRKKESKESKLREKKEAADSKVSKNDDHQPKKRGRPSLSAEEKLSRKLERLKALEALGGSPTTKSPSTKKPNTPTAAEVAAAEELHRLEVQRLNEQRMRHFEEMKEILKQKLEREKAEKKQERDVKKEQRRLLASEMKDWLRPREDLSCGGLKPLPTPIPVACGVPNHMFGEFMALLEFLNSFSDVLELHDVYPSGISFEHLENGIATKEVAGVFNDVAQLLLGAVFSLQEEEDEEITADNTIDPNMGLSVEEECDDRREAAVKLANRAAHWPTQQHNTRLHELPLDALTLTEVLRLHLLAAGASNNANAQWRHLNRGGYQHLDDPGLQFKLEQPEILKALSWKSIFDLHIEEKLKLMEVLMQQILSYAGVRDRLEETFEKIREVKMTLREHQGSYRQMEREEHQARIMKKKEIREKKKAGGTAAESETSQKEDEVTEDEEERREREEKNKERRRQEFTKKELELLLQIMALSAKANPVPLGMDRAYRRYWMFNSLPGLFVEDAEQYPGKCLDVPTKNVVDVKPENCSDTLARLRRQARENLSSKPAEESIEEKANTSDKENDGTLVGTLSLNGAFNGIHLSNGADSCVGQNKSVSETINKVVMSPRVLLSNVLLQPAPTSASTSKKSAKNCSGTVVALPKPLQKSSKDQSITKFFNVAPKTEVGLSNGVCSHPETEPESVDAPELVKDEVGEVEDTKEEFLCTADMSTCPVHGNAVTRATWSFFYQEEDIDALIGSLNDRGERESALKENLLLFRSKIDADVKSCPVFLLNPTLQEQELDTTARKTRRTGRKGGDNDTNLNFPLGTAIDEILELTLRDMILEVEEKLYVGVLGRLSVSNRDQWREALTRPPSNDQYDTVKLDWAGRSRIAQFKKELGIESITLGGGEDTALSTEGQLSPKVRFLAVALLQVAQSVDLKYLKPPLAETDKQKQKRLKAENKLRRIVEKRERKREEQMENDDNSDNSDSDAELGEDVKHVSDNSLRTPMERWEASLLTCASYSQVFLHLATLDNSVTWSRSLTKTRCRVCRKGGDHDRMLLCDGCDKGHHMYCLKPKLKSIPEGDWFCDKCKPKQKSKSPRKNRKIYVEEESDEEKGESEADENVEEEEEEVEEDVEADEGFENDLCVVCGTGGELVCCDGCPRSYHKDCAQLRKIPRGAWYCQLCTTGLDRSKKTRAAEETCRGKRDAVAAGNKKRRSATESLSARSSKRNSPDTTLEEELPSKRRRIEPETTRGSRRQLTESECLHPELLEMLLVELFAHDDAWPFLKPVNKKQVPDYYQIVKKPMDLQTMREKLNGFKYSSDAEFVADAMLIFQNCQQYNMEDTPEFKAALTLSRLFRRRANKLGVQLDLSLVQDLEKPSNKMGCLGSKRSSRKRQSL